MASRHPDAVIVFADDGEKFGVWPETHKHCYQNGWLRRFLDVLRSNRHWIQLCTFAQALDETPPAGKVYLPDGSYREMTEWALPLSQLQRLPAPGPRIWSTTRAGPDCKRFLRGGFWRNFKVKLSRNGGDVRPHAAGQPALAERARTRRRHAGEGAAGAVSRPVQLSVVARRVRRPLPAAPAQRRLPAPHRGRERCCWSDAAPSELGRRRRRPTSTSTARRKSA